MTDLPVQAGRFFFESEPCYRDPKTARYVILPVPYEGTVCFMSGTASGPEAILAVSDQIESFDEEFHVEAFRDGIVILPEIPPAVTPAEESQRIYETIKQYRLFDPAMNRFPIILGGEHGITPPIVRAAAEHVGNLSVLQFDAHTDLRDAYTGGRFSHASAMRRVLEVVPSLVQVGIRSSSAEEYADCPERVRQAVTAAMLDADFGYCVDRVLFGLTENVYITIDIDAFDPAYAPGTGTPEPGGMNWRQVTTILREVCARKNVVGVDIVEVAPLGGNNVITEYLAARLVSKIMAYTYYYRHYALPPG